MIGDYGFKGMKGDSFYAPDPIVLQAFKGKQGPQGPRGDRGDAGM